jgi:hypothetical protein
MKAIGIAVGVCGFLALLILIVHVAYSMSPWEDMSAIESGQASSLAMFEVAMKPADNGPVKIVHISDAAKLRASAGMSCRLAPTSSFAVLNGRSDTNYRTLVEQGKELVELRTGEFRSYRYSCDDSGPHAIERRMFGWTVITISVLLAGAIGVIFKGALNLYRARVRG